MAAKRVSILHNILGPLGSSLKIIIRWGNWSSDGDNVAKLDKTERMGKKCRGHLFIITAKNKNGSI